MFGKLEKESGLAGARDVDPDLKLFFEEMAMRTDGTMGSDYPEHMRMREAVKRETACSEPSSYIPERVQFTDGVMSLPGRELVYRLYRPVCVNAPAPAILFSHGGGWVTGSIDSHHALCAEIALRTARFVISIQYRRAPENPFPAGHDDVWEAWSWLFRYGDSIGVNPRALALSGDSAGGHLALTCALRHRLKGGEMPPAEKLLLWYPNTDRRPQTESRRIYAQGYGLNVDRMEFYWQCLEGDANHDFANYLLYPGHVAPPDGLPPTVFVTAEHDLLRDEAELYAERMKEAGNKVVLLRADRMLHGFARLHRESAAATLWVRRGCIAFTQLSVNPV